MIRTASRLVGFVIRCTAIDNPPMGLVGWAIELHPDRAATALISRQQSAVIAKTIGMLKKHTKSIIIIMYSST